MKYKVKLRNFETYNMMKHLNFTFPEGRGVIENYYADLVSKKIGLIDEILSVYDVKEKYFNNNQLIIYNNENDIWKEIFKSFIILPDNIMSITY